MKCSSLCVLVVLVFVASLAAQTQPGSASAKVTTAAVWQIPSSFITSAHNACDSSKPANFAQCFISQMSAAGASPQSVAFTRALYKASGGDVGILTGLHPAGPVDIAWVTYPLRANTNYGLLFVNGQPPVINAEDLKLLDQPTMLQSPQYQDTKNQFPKISVWPGDRDGTTWPNSQSGPNGGVQFTVGYPLLNGCHACERAGTALFNWNFDAQGKFQGTSFMGMTPPPVQ